MEMDECIVRMELWMYVIVKDKINKKHQTFKKKKKLGLQSQLIKQLDN
jgi:hypothetical protein